MCWWKESVVYQIYPRSFKDSNGDGVGDLQGIISRMDYLEKLGIDVIWLSPIYMSPQADNGYDIADYFQVDPIFGTMQDFDELLSTLHSRRIKLVMDLVVNHTSDEHQWFSSAKTSRHSPHYDYYHWWPSERGPPPFRWSSFDPQSNAWTYNEPTASYYLHYFSSKQPDLNWENADVRQEIYSMMRFWLDKGVDGFRMDVISLISKDVEFPSIPSKYKGDFFRFYSQGPRLHEYLREMNEQVLSKYDILTVGEGIGIESGEVLDFVNPERNELQMVYHFDGVGVTYVEDKVPPFDLVEFKGIHTKWDMALAQKGWGTIYLGNHDQPRMLSRFGDGKSATCAKLLLTFILTMRGTPFVYQGDELGMSNARFESISECRDISTLNRYEEILRNGDDLESFWKEQQRKSRDTARTPMQWSPAEPFADFSSHTPWLKVNENFPEINAQAQEEYKDSCLNFFRETVALRREHQVLIHGDYEIIDPDNPHLYVYTRSLESSGEKAIVLLNFTSLTQSFDMSDITGKPWLNNYQDFRHDTLYPWQALVFPMDR